MCSVSSWEEKAKGKLCTSTEYLQSKPFKRLLSLYGWTLETLRKEVRWNEESVPLLSENLETVQFSISMFTECFVFEQIVVCSGDSSNVGRREGRKHVLQLNNANLKIRFLRNAIPLKCASLIIKGRQ
jgi:hypothetical protein